MPTSGTTKKKNITSPNGSKVVTAVVDAELIRRCRSLTEGEAVMV